MFCSIHLTVTFAGLKNIACEQAHLFGVSCEFIGGQWWLDTVRKALGMTILANDKSCCIGDGTKVQGPVVQKAVNANPGLKVNRGFCFSS